MTREEKNAKGKELGLAACPNCGDNWYWKEDGSITYEKRKDGGSSAVFICTECLGKPEGLDINQIIAALEKYGWPQDRLELVRKAVADFKKNNS